RRQNCQHLDDFLTEVFDDALTGSPAMTVAQAVQLLSANQIEALLGCIPAGSPAPAAEQDLLELLGTIDGMGLAGPVAVDPAGRARGDLGGGVRALGGDVVAGDLGGACRSLAGLSNKVADYQRKGKLSAAQAATLGGAVADVQGILGC